MRLVRSDSFEILRYCIHELWLMDIRIRLLDLIYNAILEYRADPIQQSAQGELISLNGFLSTSQSVDMPLMLAQSSAADEHTTGIVFVIMMDPTQLPKVLFFMHALFRANDADVNRKR